MRNSQPRINADIQGLINHRDTENTEKKIRQDKQDKKTGVRCCSQVFVADPKSPTNDKRWNIKYGKHTYQLPTSALIHFFIFHFNCSIDGVPQSAILATDT